MRSTSPRVWVHAMLCSAGPGQAYAYACICCTAHRSPRPTIGVVCALGVYGSIPSPDLVISGSGISDPLVGRSRPRDLDLGFLVSVVLVVYGLRIRVPYPYVCMATDILHYAYSGPRMDHAHGRAYVHLLIWSRHLGIWDLRESGPTMASRDRSRPWIWILAPCIYVSTHAVLCLA